MPKIKYHYNRERLLLTALVAVAFFGFLLWSIEQASNNETSVLAGFYRINSPSENKVFKIDAPKVGAAIKNPVKVSGQASVFEAALQIRIKDASGLTLAREKVMTADGQKMSPFSATIKYKKPTRPKGTIEFYSLSPKDGSEVNKLAIPVVFRD